MKSHKSRRIGKRAYPLRKIVMRNISGNYRGHHFHRLHRLECGHEIPPVSDIYGELATTSMRCSLCYDEKLNSEQNVHGSVATGLHSSNADDQQKIDDNIKNNQK